MKISALSPLLLVVFLSGCPPPPVESKPTPKGPTPEQLALCLDLDWTRPRSLDPVKKAQCNDPLDSFEQKIQSCFTYDWASGEVPADERPTCERVGLLERLRDCQSKEWSEPDLIDPEERRFCHSIGFSDLVSLEVCARQDWSQVRQTKPLLREQCELLAQKTDCEERPETCEQAFQEKAFHHALHGIDLPNEKSTPEIRAKIQSRANLVGKKKGSEISCADCHNGVCSPQQKSQKYCATNRTDLSRPYHDTCAGSGGNGCHAFVTVKKGDSLTCSACHTGAKVYPSDPKLDPYGAATPGRLFGFDFAHSTHLSEEVIQKNGGKALSSCQICHSKTASGEMAKATHENCVKCHVNVSNKVQMADCLKCHTKDSVVVVKSAQAYAKSPLYTKAFQHALHKTGPDGAAVACETCHLSIDASSSLVSVKAPTMLGCLQSCHNGEHTKDKTPAFDGWTQCSKCHTP